MFALVRGVEEGVLVAKLGSFYKMLSKSTSGYRIKIIV